MSRGSGVPVVSAVPVRALAKAATPEVRDHLSNAALSLALAFKGLMEGVETPDDRSDPFEKIDLDIDPQSTGGLT